MKSTTTDNHINDPIFDWHMLKENLIDPVTIKAIIRDFAQDCTNKIASIDSAAQQKQWPLVCQQIHTLKGACATMTAQAMLRIVEALESLAHQQAGAPFATELVRLKSEHQRIQELVASENWPTLLQD